jgi:hypothetical protein
MVGLVGLEPTIFWSQTRRDSQLRYSPLVPRGRIGLPTPHHLTAFDVRGRRLPYTALVNYFKFSPEFIPHKCQGGESDSRRKDFQSFALPLSYLGLLKNLWHLCGTLPLPARRNFSEGGSYLGPSLASDGPWPVVVSGKTLHCAWMESNHRPRHYQ